MRIFLAVEKKNTFPARFATQVKENMGFYAVENTLLHIFMSYKTYGMFMINNQYANCRHQRRFRADFSDQFRKIIVRYKRIGYNINIMRQSACLVFNPITVNNFASLFNCTPVGRASDSVIAPRHKAIYFSWFGPDLFCLLLSPPVQLLVFFCSSVPVVVFDTPGSPGVGRNRILLSPHLYFIIVFICDLFVSRDDPLMS